MATPCPRDSDWGLSLSRPLQSWHSLQCFANCCCWFLEKMVRVFTGAAHQAGVVSKPCKCPKGSLGKEMHTCAWRRLFSPFTYLVNMRVHRCHCWAFTKILGREGPPAQLGDTQLGCPKTQLCVQYPWQTRVPIFARYSFFCSSEEWRVPILKN